MEGEKRLPKLEEIINNKKNYRENQLPSHEILPLSHYVQIYLYSYIEESNLNLYFFCEESRITCSFITLIQKS